MTTSQLAFVGDSVLELHVKAYLAKHDRRSSKFLHERMVRFTNAKSQAENVRVLFDRITKEEQDLVLKGRNSSASQGRKTATVMDYKYATGLEVLLGYLYFEQPQRLQEVLEIYMEIAIEHGS